jgi:hypothetical protein
VKDEIDGKKLAVVVETLNTWIRLYGPDATLDIGTTYEYGDTYARITIVQRRLETDEEYSTRVSAEHIAKQTKEQRERAEYERLKAKFGDHK